MTTAYQPRTGALAPWHFGLFVRLACWMCIVCFGDVAAAGTHQKAATARSSHAGYTMTMSNDWVESGGYRPIRIEITPHKPPPAKQGDPHKDALELPDWDTSKPKPGK